MPIHAQKASRYYRGDSFSGLVTLKLVVTQLVCVKLVVNLWRSTPLEKTDCKKRPVYAVCGYTRSLKITYVLLSYVVRYLSAFEIAVT